jgi:hypothetical protein
MTAAGLNMTVFCLSYVHPGLTQVRHTKCYQNYYPKLRRNIEVGVLIDQILTTDMKVPEKEHKYASGKDVYCAYIFRTETGLFQSIAGVQW